MYTIHYIPNTFKYLILTITNLQTILQIWELILKKLPQKEALNLRIVNKDFKTKVDQLYADWKLCLDEKCPYLDTMLNLRVKEVEIVNKLVNPVPNRPQGIIFKYPDIITKITMWEDGTKPYYHYNPGSDISAENLHIFLQYKNLKFISLVLLSAALTNEFWETLNHKMIYTFQNLQSLDINLINERGQRTHLPEHNLYEILMRRSNFPKLRSLMVSWVGILSEASIYRLAFTLIFFMREHAKTLQHFCFKSTVHFDPLLKDVFPLADLDSNLLQNCSKLETVRISSGNPSCDVLIDTWKRLVDHQSKLTDLSFSCTTYDSIELDKICKNNFKKLTKIYLRISGVVGGQFDLSIFSKCYKLKDLHLVTLVYDLELLNLESLPDKIERFTSNFFLLFSLDISRFLNKCRFLSHFTIFSLRDSDPYGCNLTVLKDILAHGSLEGVWISHLANTRSAEENEGIDQILSKLGSVAKIGASGKLILERLKHSNGTLSWKVKNNND